LVNQVKASKPQNRTKRKGAGEPRAFFIAREFIIA
jgi:hypothetical protein